MRNALAVAVGDQGTKQEAGDQAIGMHLFIFSLLFFPQIGHYAGLRWTDLGI